MRPAQSLLILFMLILCGSAIQAQDSGEAVKAQLDSMLVRVTNDEITESDFEYFERKVYRFSSNDPAKTITIINQLTEEASRSRQVKCLASLHNHLGRIYRRLGLQENALEHHLYSSELYEEIG